MKTASTTPEESRSWEHEIRAREEELRVAFLDADLDRLIRLLADNYVVNSPLQQVLARPQLLEMLRAGRIRHRAFEIEIESMSRQGDVVIVMGHDRVEDPPDGAVTRRRYTNVWQLQADDWRSIARHAHAISRDAPSILPR